MTTILPAGAEAVEQLTQLLGRASRTLVFTGAGISTHSGIPDYRGPQGVWHTRRPVFYQDFMASESARVAYWQQKLEDHAEMAAAQPNAVHHAVARLEHMGKLQMVVTQNVDGLHRKAGTSPSRLVEIHGTSTEVECQSCGRRSDPALHMEEFAATGRCPICDCGGYLKSATISFGQNLRGVDMGRAIAAAEAADLAISLGSSLVVYPAADIPLHAVRSGATYVVVNRGETDHDRNPMVTLRIEGDVLDVVPPAVDALAATSGPDDAS